MNKKEITLSSNCKIEKIRNPQKYNDLVTEMFVKYVNEYYGKTVIEKRI